MNDKTVFLIDPDYLPLEMTSLLAKTDFHESKVEIIVKWFRRSRKANL